MRRTAALLFVALAALAGSATAASAVTKTVTTTFFDTFEPGTVAIPVGGTIQWKNGGGTHNVVFTNGMYTNGPPRSGSWTSQFTFKSPGTFKYYCSKHSDHGNGGMTGLVIVDSKPPVVSSLRTEPAKFCTDQSKSCSTPGTQVKFTLSEAARVRAVVLKNGTVVKTAFVKQLAKGARAVKFAGSGLKPGGYTLRVRATDAAGNRSKPVTTTFTVKP